MELTVDVVHTSVHDAVASASVSTDDISAVGITSQAHTFTVCDSTGQSKRPFISWLDHRAGGAAESLEHDRRLAGFRHHTSFHAPTPAMQISLLRWLRDAEPGIIASTDTVEQLGPYVVGALSGQSWIDENLAAMSGLYSMETNNWWEPALDACTLRRDQLPRVCPIGTSPCKTSEVAGAFGLIPGIPVVLAGNDQTAGAYGAAIHETGALLITLGTAEVAYVCCDEMPESKPGRIRGVYPEGRFYKLTITDFDTIAQAVGRLEVDPRSVPVLAAGGGSKSKQQVERLARRLNTTVTRTEADALLGAARMAKTCGA